MLKVKEVILVEGKYDKIKLDRIIDGVVMTTGGFGVFNDKEKREFIRRLAKERGIMVLTDSDGAGLQIRNFIKNIVGDIPIKHAYIPEILGKERRKPQPGKAGLLGVEGMEEEVLLEAIKKVATAPSVKQFPLTKADLFDMGLCGGNDSRQKRRALSRKLALPTNISANALLDYINLLYSKEDILEAIRSIEAEN